jgi:hypothetical protein
MSGGRRRYTGAVPSPRLLIVGGIVLGAWCAWVSGFHTDSAAAIRTWFVSAAIVLCTDLALRSRNRQPVPGDSWRSRAEPWPRPDGGGGAGAALHGLSLWLILIGVAAAWDVLGIDTGPHEAHLTISALAQAFRPVNAALLFVWMLVGIGYGVARARAPHTQLPAAGGSPQMLAGFIVPLGGDREVPALILPSSRPVGLLFWGAVCIAAIVIDQVARRSRGSFATSGDVVRFATSAPWANILVIAAWTLAGYHLFAR